MKEEWREELNEFAGVKTYNQPSRPQSLKKDWKSEQQTNQSTLTPFRKQKKLNFFFIRSISFNLLDWMEELKKYYNSKLII